ncbi:hypothetical protein NA57DRAFT_37943 [Rhizodiscina lignyota]|uniref:PH domain-containing protein n=1 Tax=Rhizodiscina lignyota TaxID=1504668 RepID=A0A9P4IGW0_9PEZI|nr:hypothetical protein NA57DRAFT_37943 [Rhizodiscina lignyota]
MAGMEQVEIHSKSYLVRWIHVSAGNTISWSIQPHKKSLNFGIFKHPGGGVATTIPTQSVLEDVNPSTSELVGLDGAMQSRSKSNRTDNSAVVDKLKSIGLKPVSWYGRCEADKASMGKYDVVDGEGGMYGLVFDNTFSKQVSKTATFVLMTYPTGFPPKSGNNLLPSQSLSSTGSRGSPSLNATGGDSTDSLPQSMQRPKLDPESRPRSGQSGGKSTADSMIYTGILHKKRRKRNQGYARRFFSLDFTSSTLSYYQNRHSSALRGSVPLSLAAIGTDDNRREISVDSGAEVWHLRAGNQKDFEAWKQALERASKSGGPPPTPGVAKPNQTWDTPHEVNPAEESEWARVENLVGSVSGVRDAVRRLAKDTDPKYLPSLSGLGINRTANSPSPSVQEESSDYFGEGSERGSSRDQRIPFWKRRASKEAGKEASPSGGITSSGIFRRSVSAQLAVPSPMSQRQHQLVHEHAEHDDSIHEHCMAILKDLDVVVSEFSALVAESRQRRQPPAALHHSASRQSTDSLSSSDEWFDATDGDTVRSQLLTIRRDSVSEDNSDEPSHAEDASDALSMSSSEYSAPGSFERKGRADADAGMFPVKPKSLTPLPIDRAVKRRKLVPPAKVQPPSLIGFLRKNVGKDLSTIAMPVSANEPTSLLQRVAEQLEYSELLDAACDSVDTSKRLLHIAAFAVAGFSNSRVKERAIRKPFNPMLGETFELVREDKGFRLISEKVSHRPVRMACQAESERWTFLQSPMPVQKFWGKSIELNTDGRARVFLHTVGGEKDKGEVYSWTLATSFLRNIIAGEKYVEPVQTMTVVNESTGAKAVCAFKAGGMFAGRSEDVTVQALDAHGGAEALGLVGKWTSHLNYTSHGSDTGKTLWAAGPLVDNAPSRYGFTHFAATLNEITAVEDGHLPATDSRLRPDQRAAEDGDLDRAEALKARLEERQRGRRRVMEEHGEQWTPRWFTKVGTVNGEDGGEEIWRLRTGKEGYWEERATGKWTDVTDVFAN